MSPTRRREAVSYLCDRHHVALSWVLEGIANSFSGLLDEVALFDTQLADANLLDHYFAESATATMQASASSVITLVEDQQLLTTNENEQNGFEVTVLVSTDASAQSIRIDFSDLVFDAGSQTDPNDRITRFTFDAKGRQLTRTLPLGQSESMSYFTTGLHVGMLASTTDFLGNTTSYTYDTLGREKTHTYKNASNVTERVVTMTYDALGRVKSIADSVVGTTSYTYDAEGRVVLHTTPQGTLSYEYDPATGRQTAVNTGLTRVIYAYDALGRHTQVKEALRNGQVVNGITTYGYNVLGEWVTKTAPNGVTTTHTRDALGRLITLETKNSSGGLVFKQDQIAYDKAGNRTSLRETTDDGTVVRMRWEYDALNRLTKETRDQGDNAVIDGADYADTFTFDLASNRGTKARDAAGSASDETITYTYDANDRLLSEDSTINVNDKAYGYNANGSLTSESSASGGKNYRWDAMGRMTGIDADNNGSYETTYRYDADGVRVSVTQNGSTTTYLHDHQNPTGYAKPIEEWIDPDSGGPLAKTIARSYVVGLMVESQWDAQDGTITLTHDAHGSTRAILNAATAAVAQRLAYDAFGKTITGAALTSADAALTTWLFAGDGQYDPASKLSYHLARWRGEHRFIGKDSWAGDAYAPTTTHGFNYVLANPIISHDPSGYLTLTGQLATTSIIGMLAGSVIGGIRGGVEGAVVGAVTGAIFAPVITAGAIGAGIGFASLTGISTSAGIATSFAIVTSASLAFNTYEVLNAKNDRDRLAAGVSMLLLVGGTAYGGIRFASLPKLPASAKPSILGLFPKSKSNLGVLLSEYAALLRGERVVAREVTLLTSSGWRPRIDLVTRTVTGKLRLIEAKNGPYSQPTKSQANGYPEILRSGAEVRGINGESAGLRAGDRLPPTEIQIDTWNGSAAFK